MGKDGGDSLWAFLKDLFLPFPPVNMAEIVRCVVLPAPSGKMESARISRDPFAHADGSRECRPVAAVDLTNAAVKQQFAQMQQAKSHPALASLVAIGARSDGRGWHVQLMRGGSVIASLTPNEAEALARELTDTAAVVRGEKW